MVRDFGWHQDKDGKGRHRPDWVKIGQRKMGSRIIVEYICRKCDKKAEEVEYD